MANSKVLVIQSGITKQIPDADTAIVGAGIRSAVGSTLTITSDTGLLTVNGVGGISLQGNGTPALTVNSTGTTLTIQAGTTLTTTGTGNINLPVNGSAKFQIESVAISGTNVTAANFNKIFDGSNADALHTHTAVTANQIVIASLTTTGLGDGDFGYISAANVISKTDADAIVSSIMVGANEGTIGSMTVAGIIESAKFTTAGGSPGNGAVVYLAPGTEEASASGKLTATAPTTTGKVVAEVGIVIDNANYAGSKTAKILLSRQKVVQL